MAGVIILGAGLAGLGCARELPGARIYEANAYVGGHVFSHALAGVPFDEGAHISHAKDPTFVEMINRAAGEVVTVPRSIVRNVWQGHWISYPVQNNLRELPEDLRIAALTDLVQAQLEPAGTPANYREWCRRQYGQTLASTFYEVYTPKYWRVPSEELACDWMGGRVLPSMMGRIVEGRGVPCLRGVTSGLLTVSLPGPGWLFRLLPIAVRRACGAVRGASGRH
jgi:protoporphyrinogen oxidase